jgi:hypothetical protein
VDNFGYAGLTGRGVSKCFQSVTFIKLHLRVCNPTDASEFVRILMMRNCWRAVRAVLEVLITKRRPTKWEWGVCDRYGTTIIGGFESTRPAAKYRGNRALFLFLLLSTGCAR